MKSSRLPLSLQLECLTLLDDNARHHNPFRLNWSDLKEIDKGGAA